MWGTRAYEVVILFHIDTIFLFYLYISLKLFLISLLKFYFLTYTIWYDFNRMSFVKRLSREMAWCFLWLDVFKEEPGRFLIFNFSFSFLLLSVLYTLVMCIFFYLYFCFWYIGVYACIHSFVHVIRHMYLCEWLFVMVVSYGKL